MNIKMKRGIFMKNNIIKTLSKKEFATLEIQKDDFLKLLNDILESPIDLKMDIITDEEAGPGYYTLNFDVEDEMYEKLDDFIASKYSCSLEDDYEVLYAMLKNAFKTDSLKTRLNWMDEEDGEYTIIVTLPLEDYISIMK